MKTRTLAPLLVLIALSVTATPALAGQGYENVTSTFGGPCPASPTPCPGGQFNEPTAIAVNDETGQVYVLDSGNDRIEWFSEEGKKFGGEFNGSGTLPGEGKAAGSDGLPGEIQTGKFLNPEGIAVDNSSELADPSKGDVYVADAGHGVVDKYSPTGKYEGQIGGPFTGLLEVATDPFGNVWVYEANAGHVYEFDDTGSLLETFSTSQTSTDPGFVVDSNGNVYVVRGTNPTTRRVVEFERATGNRLVELTDSAKVGATLGMIASTSHLLVDEVASIELFTSPITEGAQPILTFPATGLSESAGIAVNGAQGEGTIYATQRGADDVDVFASAPPEAPTVISESAFSTTAEEGGFSAVINPGNRETTYLFEYALTEEAIVKGEGTKLPGTASIPAEFGEQKVTVGEAFFEPEQTYYYRVIAENEESKGTPTLGPVEAYTKIPLIAKTEERFSELTSTSATLEAAINPVFEETTYAFEYATGEHAKELLEEGKGTVIHGTTGIHQLEKLGEFEKMEAALDKEAQEEAEGKLPPGTVPPGTLPICPGIVEEGGTGTLPTANKPCPVSAEIFGLTPGQTYYYRVVTENAVTREAGNANEGHPAAGEIKEFTPYAAPRTVTGEAQNITGTAATLSGSVNPEDTTVTYHFAYISKAALQEAIKNGAANPEAGEAAYRAELAKGAPSPYAAGETTATNALPEGDQPVAVGPIPATDLLPGDTYHYALVAVNKYAIQSIGPDRTFTTRAGRPPAVSTGAASGVSQSSATLYGTVTTNGLQTNYGFEIGSEPGNYGPATGLGAIGGASSETVSVTLSKLQPGRTYYYRITATNADGTREGEPESFTTPAFPSLIAVPTARSPLANLNIAFPKEEPATQSSTITVLSHKVKANTATIKLSVPSAGRLVATGRGLSKASKTASRAGALTIKLTLSKGERAFLKKHPARRLKTTIHLTFTTKTHLELKTTITIFIG